MQAQQGDVFDACRKGDLGMVQELYAADPTIIQQEDMKGFTPLIIAVYNNQPEVVDFLLEKGAQPDEQDRSGNSALMGVCFKGYTAIAQKLVAAGADVNQRNSQGAPALTFAATFGHLEIARLLLEHGADTSLRDSRGKSPLDHAMIQENTPMVELIQQYV
ncbi:ankyrin repeat domain-containing protein [Segetibacter sp. 3557_3]|uniref:ankyrin repeat domain-containing protein n=1 Tax=Segetibacter sp. 3557_3 TaxID=2547429 RepID=UPI00105887B3|nr:ankyrin repeat domain-containing protein [Segetibacter sp. 3557_3]TDH18367.1 ankyrin repeat domain-containing protein [Segetibacter sp. 3557_3]